MKRASEGEGAAETKVRDKEWPVACVEEPLTG